MASSFTGHPDLRRMLMWDGFKDHPMRKDYVEPDDYEYEPTRTTKCWRGRKSIKAGKGARE
jgi:NADH-quinone oxidoreductase subunit C